MGYGGGFLDETWTRTGGDFKAELVTTRFLITFASLLTGKKSRRTSFSE